jgi:hypothetical protein
VDARDAQIDAAVAAGDITEERAELLRNSMMGGPGPFGGFGGRGRGHGGPGGLREFRGFDGFGPSAASDDATTSEDTSISI